MLGYVVAWVVYVASALAIWWVYQRGIARLLPETIRSVVAVLMMCVLLTPWPIDQETWLLAPAIIATIFNVFSGFGIAALKSLSPILLVSTIACFVAWLKTRKSY
ncbi:MAG TPA: hypothetical protein PKL69_02895 [Agitococcus sp.]|nr:hypothetical protein [Agitococcus sp.]HMY29302.1 hypothetical protein [Agitococcus sp.]HNB20565.1 hypothetical protein [Agitococcus sp.]HNC03146.1 hypothetical protein [Agitococcus sp.]HNC87211.1 hypothetical protein [Agitococcus sp.]